MLKTMTNPTECLDPSSPRIYLNQLVDGLYHRLPDKSISEVSDFELDNLLKGESALQKLLIEYKKACGIAS